MQGIHNPTSNPYDDPSGLQVILNYGWNPSSVTQYGAHDQVELQVNGMGRRIWPHKKTIRWKETSRQRWGQLGRSSPTHQMNKKCSQNSWVGEYGRKMRDIGKWRINFRWERKKIRRLTGSFHGTSGKWLLHSWQVYDDYSHGVIDF